MLSDHDCIRAHFYQSRGMKPDGSEYQKQRLNVDKLKRSEWVPEFEQLQRNRLIIGACRYGLLNGQGKPQYDRMQAIIKRAQEYKDTGNDELLIDISNLCMLEYAEGDHPFKHFFSIDDGIHVNSQGVHHE